MNRALFVAAALLLAGPAIAGTPQPETYGVGDTVFRTDIKEPLPNVFGKPDIWGRKRVVGQVTVRYLGLHDGVAAFQRIDTSIYNDETTMSRMPTRVQGTGYGNAYGGGFNATVSEPRPATVAPTGQTAMDLTVTPGPDAELVIAGHHLHVLQATGSTVTIQAQ